MNGSLLLRIPDWILILLWTLPKSLENDIKKTEKIHRKKQKSFDAEILEFGMQASS